MTRLAAVLLTLLAVPASLDGARAAGDDRYVLERQGDGFVRMDRRTGEISTCAGESGGALVCKLAADERTAYQDEIDRLQTSVDDLRGRVEKLEGSLSQRLESKLPTQQEFDQTMGFMEQFLRRFMGVVEDMNRKSGDGSPADGTADRT